MDAPARRTKDLRRTMSESAEIQEVLLSLLGEKRDDEQAVSFIERLMRISSSTESDSEERRAHLRELNALYQRVLLCIKTNPGTWYEKLHRDIRKHRRRGATFLKGFDGITQKRVTDESGETRLFKRDPRGEYLPVSSDDKQLSDTALLLKLVAEEDYETIEKLGYKVKRRGSGSSSN